MREKKIDAEVMVEVVCGNIQDHAAQLYVNLDRAMRYPAPKSYKIRFVVLNSTDRTKDILRGLALKDRWLEVK